MRRIFLRTLASILALLGLTSISQAQWVAFNDHVPGVGTHPNATTLKIPAVGGPTSTNMLLKNIGNGTNLPVTLTITRSSAGVTYNANGSGPASGTPMFNTFNGFVSFAAA